MLLPGVAKQHTDGTPEQISDTIRYTISFCVLLGTSAVLPFSFSVRGLDVSFSKQKKSAFSAYPFIFKSFSLSGNDTWKHFKRPWKNFSRFFQNLAGDVIRILAILFLVPVFGIRGYLYGILASELTIMTMALLFLHRESANGFAVH